MSTAVDMPQGGVFEPNSYHIVRGVPVCGRRERKYCPAARLARLW